MNKSISCCNSIHKTYISLNLVTRVPFLYIHKYPYFARAYICSSSYQNKRATACGVKGFRKERWGSWASQILINNPCVFLLMVFVSFCFICIYETPFTDCISRSKQCKRSMIAYFTRFFLFCFSILF